MLALDLDAAAFHRAAGAAEFLQAPGELLKLLILTSSEIVFFEELPRH